MRGSSGKISVLTLALFSTLGFSNVSIASPVFSISDQESAKATQNEAEKDTRNETGKDVQNRKIYSVKNQSALTGTIDSESKFFQKDTENTPEKDDLNDTKNGEYYVNSSRGEEGLSKDEREALHRVLSDEKLTLNDKIAIKRAYLANHRSTKNLHGEENVRPETNSNTASGSGDLNEPGKDMDKIFRGAEEMQNVTLGALLGISGDNRDLRALSPEQIRDDLKNLKGMLQVTQPLRVGNMFAVEARPGKMIWFSQDGRYFFQGTMYDLFSGMKPLKNINDVKEYALKTDYRRLQLDPDELSSARIGNGPKHVVIYVDPQSKVTRDLISSVLKFPERKDFTFWFVVIPSQSDESKRMAKAFYCAREAGNTEIGNLLYSGELEKLGYSEKDCNDYNWNKTVTAAYYTGVDVLPFFVGDDGRQSRGEPPQGLYNWLLEQTAADPQTVFPDDDENSRRGVLKKVEEKALYDAAQGQIKSQVEGKASSKSDVFPEQAEEEEEDLPILGESSQENEDGVVTGEIKTSSPAFNATEPQQKSGSDNRNAAAQNHDPVSGGVYNSELSETEQLHSGEIVQDPTQTVDLSGFDNSEEIRRYLAETQQTNDEPVVENGVDQAVNLEAEGSKDARKTADSELSKKKLQERDFNQNDRPMVEEINSLRTQIEATQNQARLERLRARDKYDTNVRDIQRALEAIENDTSSTEFKNKRREEKYERMNIFWNKYQTALSEIDQKEKAKINDLSSQIKFIKQSMKDGGTKFKDEGEK